MNRELTGKRALLVYLLSVLLGLAVLTGHESIAAPADKASSAPGDFKRLEGRWTRPDGGYVLELKDIKKDGSISAAYYNPRPVKVYLAKAGKKDGTITLYVELRDINYPGSNYNLVYDAKADRLRGSYFQAVEKRTFEVEFVRMK